MTELERELLRAFEDLQASYEKQQQEWQRGYESLQTMFENTQRDNQALKRQVMNLSGLVATLSDARDSRTEQLSGQVLRLAQQVEGLHESVKRWTAGKR